MAIQTVQAIINGQSYTLALNSATGKYEATITAPGKTSYNQSGGYYNVQIKATNDAGTVGSADASTLNGLKLYVKEKVAPVITILSPSSGAYVSNSKQPVVFTVTDETDGSGVDLSTLVVKQDGAAVASSALTSTAIANGYQVTYTPASALDDGSHTVTIDCKDHDGNAAAQKSTTYTVDTVPPTLNVTAPTDNLITNTAALTVAGITNDATLLARGDQDHAQRRGSGRRHGRRGRRVQQGRHAGGGREYHRHYSDRRGGQGLHGHAQCDA